MSTLAQLEAWSEYDLGEGLKLMNESPTGSTKKDSSVQVNVLKEPTKVSYQFSRYKTVAVIFVSFIAIGILCHQGSICISRFMTKDTMIRERVISTKEAKKDIEASFIDLTICPDYHYAYKKEALQGYGLTKDQYRLKAMYSPNHIHGTSSINLKRIFNSVTYNINEILHRIVISTSNKNDPHFNIDFNSPNFTQYIDISTKYWPTYGRCYSIHPKEHVLKLGVWGIDIFSRINIYIYFGYPGQFMYPTSKSKAYSKLGQKIFLDFTYEVSVNTLGNLKKHKCNPYMNHNYDDEFYSMIAHENEALFNCSVPFHPITISNLTGKAIEICKNPKIAKKALENFSDTCAAGPQTTKNKPCTSVDIFLGLPFVDDEHHNHEASIRIYTKAEVKVKSIIMYYDFTSLIADLGGYIGMLMGISMVDLTIMFNTALLILTMKLKNKYRNNE